MNMKDKKYRRSGVSIACYVIAAIMLVYVCYQIGSTVSTINEYYAQYEMNATPMEYLTYCGQAALQPFFYALATFMFGFILDAVRKNNKANYLSDEELEAAKEAKREAKDAKKFAKGEAAAAKAGNGNVATAEKSVEADFAKSLDEELKADEKKSDSKGQGQKKSGGNRRNSSYNNRANGGNKNNGSKSGNNRRNSSKKPAAEKAEDKAEAKSEE